MARSNSDNGVCGMDFSMMSILWRHRESMPTQNISCFRAKTQKSDRKTGLIHPFNGLIQQSLIGVGFSFEATQEEGHDCGKLNCSRHFRLPENNHAPPTCTLSVERHRWQAISANEQAD